MVSPLLQTKKIVCIFFSPFGGARGDKNQIFRTLEAAVAATNSKVNLAIVDIDVNSDLAMDHEVQAVPTVVAFKEGKMVDKFIGLLDEDRLDAFITKLHQ